MKLTSSNIISIIRQVSPWLSKIQSLLTSIASSLSSQSSKNDAAGRIDVLILHSILNRSVLYKLQVMEERIKNLIKKNGLAGVNKPKATPSHPKKSHIVLAKEGNKTKLIRFGEQGADTVTESNPTGARAKKRASFKARHAKNIAKGKMSAAYWADRVKW